MSTQILATKEKTEIVRSLFKAIDVAEFCEIEFPPNFFQNLLRLFNGFFDISAIASDLNFKPDSISTPLQTEEQNLYARLALGVLLEAECHDPELFQSLFKLFAEKLDMPHVVKGDLGHLHVSMTLLMKACSVADDVSAQLMLNAGADIHARDESGRDALSWVIELNPEAFMGGLSYFISEETEQSRAIIIKMLAENGVDLNKRWDRIGGHINITPIMLCCSDILGTVGVLNALMENGAKLEDSSSLVGTSFKKLHLRELLGERLGSPYTRGLVRQLRVLLPKTGRSAVEAVQPVA